MKSTILVAAVVALFGIANAAQAAGDVAAGKAKAKACAGCHGCRARTHHRDEDNRSI